MSASRLVFFYVMHRKAKYYFNFLQQEGYFYILQKLIEKKVISDCLVVIESSENLSILNLDYKIKGITVSKLEDVPLKKNDIIFVRGGWKGWYDTLKKWSINHLMINYSANTGRGKWLFWDYVFDDLLIPRYFWIEKKCIVNFRKPVHPDVFYYDKKSIIKYDLCVGASHVHDKKGQWRTIKVLIEYKKKYGKNLKCILPGSFQRGVYTNNIKNNVKKYNLDVQFTGSVSRFQLNKIYNQSKMFIHLGEGGQGDRSTGEAMVCGCSLIIGAPRYHAYWICKENYVPDNINNFKDIAENLFERLKFNDRQKISDLHFLNTDVEKYTIPQMKKMIKKGYNNEYCKTDDR